MMGSGDKRRQGAVDIHPCPLEWVSALASETVGVQKSVPRGYKPCDLRPAFGHVVDLQRRRVTLAETTMRGSDYDPDEIYAFEPSSISPKTMQPRPSLSLARHVSGWSHSQMTRMKRWIRRLRASHGSCGLTTQTQGRPPAKVQVRTGRLHRAFQ